MTSVIRFGTETLLDRMPVKIHIEDFYLNFSFHVMDQQHK